MKLVTKRSDTLSIIQLTDTHLYADSQSKFGDIVTEDSLRQVLDLAQSSSQWPPDLILATGDLVQEPVTQSYERFFSIINRLNVPVVCLPGNHDDPELMQQLLNQEYVSTNKCIETKHWCILLLDSFKANTHSGELRQQELDFLQQRLEKYHHKHILIALHHHPISIHSAWMDSMMLLNPEPLLALIDHHPKVRAVIWGHIHQEFQERRNGVDFIGSPSTCAQFKPAATEYARDTQKPAYRSFLLSDDGGLSTSVHRLVD